MIDHFSEKVMIVVLEHDPDIGTNLRRAIEEVNNNPQKNVVVDFDNLETLDRGSIELLLCLKQILESRQRKMVLCNVVTGIMGLFCLLGHEGKFKIFAELPSAIEELSK